MVAGFLYMTLALGALIVLRARDPEGVLLILWLVLIVVATDVGAYFVGRSLGGRKLWPRVSPGKTWSGALGGLAFAGATGIAFGVAVGWSPLRIGLLSLGISIFSQFGDLLESAVKRRFGVKDASRLIPGPRRADGPARRGAGRRVVLRDLRQPRARRDRLGCVPIKRPQRC